MIRTKMQLTEKRVIIDGDTSPIYVFEALGDDTVKLGKVKLRVSKERAKRMLRDHDYFDVTITPSED
jgi:hypothetical protein